MKITAKLGAYALLATTALTATSATALNKYDEYAGAGMHHDGTLHYERAHEQRTPTGNKDADKLLYGPINHTQQLITNPVLIAAGAPIITNFGDPVHPSGYVIRALETDPDAALRFQQARAEGFSFEDALAELFRSPEMTYGAGDVIGLHYALSRGFSGKGAKVGIFDSGIYNDGLETSAEGKYLGGFDFLYDENDPLYDPTFVGAHGQLLSHLSIGEWNGFGTMGTGPDAGFYSFRVSMQGGTSSLEPLDFALNAAAYDKAREVRLDVTTGAYGIFLERGGREEFDYSAGKHAVAKGKLAPVAAAINKLHSSGNYKGTVVTFAAGNASFDNPSIAHALIPHYFPEVRSGGDIVVVVTGLAVDDYDPVTWDPREAEAAYYASRCGVAKDYCITAPAEGYGYVASQPAMQVDGAGNFPKNAEGTSAATGMTTGAIATIRGAFPELTAEQTVQLLFATAIDIGAPGVDEVFGNGLIDLKAALQPYGSLNMPDASRNVGVKAFNQFAAPSTLNGGLLPAINDVIANNRAAAAAQLDAALNGEGTIATEAAASLLETLGEEVPDDLLAQWAIDTISGYLRNATDGDAVSSRAVIINDAAGAALGLTATDDFGRFFQMDLGSAFTAEEFELKLPNIQKQDVFVKQDGTMLGFSETGGFVATENWSLAGGVMADVYHQGYGHAMSFMAEDTRAISTSVRTGFAGLQVVFMDQDGAPAVMVGQSTYLPGQLGMVEVGALLENDRMHGASGGAGLAGFDGVTTTAFVAHNGSWNLAQFDATSINLSTNVTIAKSLYKSDENYLVQEVDATLFGASVGLSASNFLGSDNFIAEVAVPLTAIDTTASGELPFFGRMQAYEASFTNDVEPVARARWNLAF